jgi:hypothetical protein
MENQLAENDCYDSGLPTPSAYMDFFLQNPSVIPQNEVNKENLSDADMDRIIEMAWEDRKKVEVLPFSAQFRTYL